MSVLYLDLETASVEELWTSGVDFIRLAGYAIDDGPVHVTADIEAVVDKILKADYVVGHNILSFDLPALARHFDLNIGDLVTNRRVVDTLVVARQNDPPLSDKTDSKRYGLDAVARHLGMGAKLANDDVSMLKGLAKEYGGFDRIPLDEPRYIAYLRQHVELVRAIAGHLVVDEYCWREHEVLHRLGYISQVGFRVDVAEAARIVTAQETRIECGLHSLHERFGLPLEGKKPQATTRGKQALERAFIECGVAAPRTAKGGLATGQTALDALISAHPENDQLMELCTVLRSLNGERSTVQTLLERTHSDGRIHPDVDARQATGRISVTKPALTTAGKRKRKNIVERALLLPDPGHVLIAFDLSQIDARAMAAHCEDPDYLAAFEPGKDLHSEMAVALFGRADWDGSGHHPRRNDAKPVTHATSYGMGASGLAITAGLEVEDARAMLARLDAQFPKLAEFKWRIREVARRDQVLSNAFGRMMRVRPGAEYTQAPAFIGQGTARDLMMQGILRLPEWLLPSLRAIVHDEIVLSVPVDRAADAEAAVLDALEFEFAVPGSESFVMILADKSDRGGDWADCYRSEKSAWPEVSREHRNQVSCDDGGCEWHTI